MSARHPAPPEQQPKSFAFTAENEAEARKIVAKYPAGRQQSAVMPLLDIAQRQNANWLPLAAMQHVADFLSMPYIRVLEVATFYTMYNLAPVGRHFVQVCTTTPCWLRGSDAVVKACEKTLGVGLGGTTADGKFTLVEVECLGACVNAPMVQINDDFYEDLDAESTAKILEALRRGEQPKLGPQSGRESSEPLGGATTLTSIGAGE
jgi:NADH-quinone oxidoreductase subunit E